MRKGDLCFISGISGYLASWLASTLLNQGYRVRGSIRDLADSERIAALRRILPGVEIVVADLRKEAGWPEAVNGCQWVFHVASPQADKGERDRTAGAVSGTRFLLAAAFASLSVRKVVITSSEAAIAYGHPRSKRVFDEGDWTDLDAIGAPADYFRSKTLAEQLAWQMARQRDTNPRRIPVAVVNPCLILGPSLVPWGRFSLKMLADIATGKMSLLLDIRMHIVDVRDCAQMHVAIMADPASGGRRYLSMAFQASLVDLARSIGRQFERDLGLKPATRVAPAWLAWVLAVVSRDVASIRSHIGNRLSYQTLHPNIYRYEHCNIDEIVRESIDSMVAHRWLAPKSSPVMPDLA